MKKNHFGLGISFIAECERKNKVPFVPVNRTGSDVESNEIKRVLFSRDPETGMPCGNLGSALSGQPLNVQQSILGQVGGTGNDGTDDVDLALESVKLNRESADDFNSRMQGVAKRELDKVSKNKKS